eukprot:g45231.t1
MPSTGTTETNVAADIERRASRMKEKLASGDMVRGHLLYAVIVVAMDVCHPQVNDAQKQVRESWMVELPPVLQNIGLGARTFKRRANGESSDRSVWTDTPADRERKAQASWIKLNCRELEGLFCMWAEGKSGVETLKAKDSPAEEFERPSLSERDKRMAKEVASYNVSV